MNTDSLNKLMNLTKVRPPREDKLYVVLVNGKIICTNQDIILIDDLNVKEVLGNLSQVMDDLKPNKSIHFELTQEKGANYAGHESYFNCLQIPYNREPSIMGEKLISKEYLPNILNPQKNKGIPLQELNERLFLKRGGTRLEKEIELEILFGDSKKSKDKIQVGVRRAYSDYLRANNDFPAHLDFYLSQEGIFAGQIYAINSWKEQERVAAIIPTESRHASILFDISLKD